ncbi:MAG: outer membrane lipoprotein carrier protein LolA, partial [Treponemataceae bacterium]|nr:outer membrane lipoprotein carrier protein LolA [Treponemataceae bacterium]
VMDASSNQIFTSISSTLFSMFSGDAQKLGENFTVDFSASGADWKAVLTPKDAAVSAVMASIAVSGTRAAASAELNKIVMTEGSGDTITYTFTNQNYPEVLTDDEKAYFIAK